MPTFSSSAILNLLGAEDSTQAIPINRGAQVTLDATYGQIAQTKTVVAGTPVVEQIPLGKAFCAYVRNLSAPGGSSISLTITPSGGAPYIITIAPGDFWCIWSATLTGTAIAGVSQGITALTVASGAGTAIYEIYLGG